MQLKIEVDDETKQKINEAQSYVDHKLMFGTSSQEESDIYQTFDRLIDIIKSLVGMQ